MTKPAPRKLTLAIVSNDRLAHVTGGDTKTPPKPPPTPPIETIWKDGNISSIDDWQKHNT